MPEIGVSMDEGTLARWLKQPGDAVAAGEAIAEIETDKAAVELESPADGVLGRHLVAEGATALVGQALVRVLAPGESEDSRAAPAAAGSLRRPRRRPRRCPGRSGSRRRPTAPPGGRPHRLTPRARRHRARARHPLRVGRRRRPRERRARPDRRAGPPAAATARGVRSARARRRRLSRPHRAQGQRGLDDDPALRRHARGRLRGAARAGRLVQARGHGRHRHRPPAGRPSRARSRRPRRPTPISASPSPPTTACSSRSSAASPGSGSAVSPASARAPSSAPARAASRRPISAAAPVSTLSNLGAVRRRPVHRGHRQRADDAADGGPHPRPGRRPRTRARGAADHVRHAQR